MLNVTHIFSTTVLLNAALIITFEFFNKSIYNLFQSGTKQAMHMSDASRKGCEMQEKVSQHTLRASHALLR